MAHLTCPYCFERIKPDTLAFRCVNAVRCGTEEDRKLYDYVHGGTPGSGRLGPERLGRVFTAGSKARRMQGLPIEAECPQCHDRSTKALCPHCHNELPHRFGLVEACPIALIGAKGAGKSNYIAVVIHEFMRRLSTVFDASLEALDDQTRKRYADLYEAPLFHAQQVVAQTISAASDLRSRYPLSYTIDFRRRQLFGTAHRIAGLTFFDTAGEDLLSSDVMTTHNRYMTQAQGLIVLFDPLQIPALRQLLPGSSGLPPVNPYQHQIIERVIQLLQKTRAIRPGQLIDIPLALAFSKVDLLNGVVDPQLLRAAEHPGKLNLNDIEQNHILWRAYLEEWGYSNLTQLLTNSFKRWRFFGLSALGAAPLGNVLERSVSAFRVEDPLLWLFYENGIIDADKKR
jgi:GTPase SAR1 family protein